MNTSQEFETWLIDSKNGRRLARSSVYAYARAIHTISEDMRNEGVLERGLYNTTSTLDLLKVIAEIQKNDYFIKKNSTGHNMYSVALSHYLEFIRVSQ